jgi:hypothetical protein
MDNNQIEKAQRVEACIADVMERFPRDSKEYYVEVHQHLAPLARQLERDRDTMKQERDELRAEVERLRADAARYRWLCDAHNTEAASYVAVYGGADLGAAIDRAIGASTEKPA